MTCPHCKAATITHPDGREHCNACGCCMRADGSQNPGHPMCPAAQRSADARRPEPEPQDAAIPDEPPAAVQQHKARKGALSG